MNDLRNRSADIRLGGASGIRGHAAIAAEKATAHLISYTSILLQAGWTRYRVDELHNPETGWAVRYGYAGGEWRVRTIPTATDLQLGAPAPWTIKFDFRHALPSLETLLRRTVEADTTGLQFDANRETMIRG